MSSVPVPICYSCVHLHDQYIAPDRLRCNAFPDGIPDDILDSEFDHRLPHDGDNGIQFAQTPVVPPPDELAFE